MRKGHAFLPPSGADKWKVCAKWPTMNRDYPQESGPAAKEGTAAHWVVEQMIQDNPAPLPPMTPEGVEITEEMIEGGTLVLETLAQRVSGWPLISEGWTAINRIHVNCWGRGDLAAYHSERRVLEVFEYKFGRGYVEETANPQMIAYATGYLATLPESEKITVNMTVIQPRCYGKDPVRTWTTKPGELEGYIEELHQAALRAHEPNPVGTPGKHCEWCPGRHVCPELQAQAALDAQFAFQVLPVDASIKDTARELGLLEDAAERLSARITGLQEVVKNAITQGTLVEGYALQPGRGKTVWSIPMEQVAALGELMGKDLSKPGVLTPKQAVKTGIPEEVIKGYSQHLPGEFYLTRHTTNEALKAFQLLEDR